MGAAHYAGSFLQLLDEATFRISRRFDEIVDVPLGMGVRL